MNIFHLLVGFSYALEALILTLEAEGEIFSAEEKRYPKDLREGKKIAGTVRVFQDRFAYFFQSCRLPREDYEPLKNQIFSSWTDWNHRDLK